MPTPENLVPLSCDVPVSWRDMRIDEVEGGIPELQVDLREYGGPAFRVRLAPDALRALVDGLAGVAPPPPGEVRLVIRMDASELVNVLLARADRAAVPVLPPGGQHGS